MSDLDCFLNAIRIQESGGNYGAYNGDSGAGGAYQFLPSTWQYALNLAGEGDYIYSYPTANQAPPWLQDKAAAALMLHYFDMFGDWYSVAEAWYGGPGAVGHPDWGGGPGYPNVGQYADEVMANYRNCGGGGGGGAPAGPVDNPNDFPAWRGMNIAWDLVQWIYGPGVDGDLAPINYSGGW